MKNFIIFFQTLLISILLIGCEPENPGEPIANRLPDTNISDAFPGNVTTIYFYGTDEDGFVNKYACKWEIDSEWSITENDSIVFYDIFTNQNEVKRFYVKAIDNQGTEDPSPAEIVLSPENSLPTTKILSGPEFGKESGEDVQFTFTGEDIEAGGSVVSFQYTMDDLENWQDTPVSYPQAMFMGLSEGSHTFYVRSVDNLGGTDPTPAQTAFVVRSGHFAPVIENKSPVVNGGGWFARYPLTFQWNVIVEHYYGILPSAAYSYSYNDLTNFNLEPNAPLSSGWVSDTSATYFRKWEHILST